VIGTLQLERLDCRPDILRVMRGGMLYLVAALVGCTDRAATNDNSDLAVADDLSASVDLAAPDLAVSHTDLAVAAVDLARNGIFDGGIEAGCTQASCGARVCGPSACGYNCGGCGAGQGCAGGGTCGNCAPTCSDDNGDAICGGEPGFRRCADGTVRVCTCEGPPNVWLCTPPCP